MAPREMPQRVLMLADNSIVALPDGIGGLGSTISDSGADRRLSSAEITAETTSSLWRTLLQ